MTSESSGGAIVASLVQLGNALGDSAHGLAILGEGNVSADLGDGDVAIKASGATMSAMTTDDVVRLRRAPLLALVDRAQDRGGSHARREVEETLAAAGLETGSRRPSVEVFLHAVCQRAGARFVGHVHATACNQILCSRSGAEPFQRHLFPESVVVCGAEPVVVPYVDPGLQLGITANLQLERYRRSHASLPKLLLLVNHGIVALGGSPNEVLAIALMAEKWARVLVGTYAVGGPSFLSHEAVADIDEREDEDYRRQELHRG